MRISFNANGDTVGDVSYFLDVIRKLKPSTTLIMNNIGLANQVYDVTNGETITIFRKWFADDGDFWRTKTPKETASLLIQTGGGDATKHIYKQIMNEPAAKGSDWKKLSDWVSDTVKYMTDAGHKVVAPNLAVGTYEKSDVANGYFDSMLVTLGERSDVALMGLHEYTAFLLPFGLGYWDRWNLRDRNFVQPQGWPKASELEDYRSQYIEHFYHLMRSTWFNVRRKDIGAKQHKIVLTEFGWDRMVDLTYGQNHIYQSLERQVGVPSPYTEMRGAYTHENLWHYYWPDWSTSQAILEQFKWADSIYPEWYIGFTPFMWSFGDQWENYGFNYGKDRDLHNLMIEWSQGMDSSPIEVPPDEPPPPVVTPPSIPTTIPVSDTRWFEAWVSSVGVKTNVRQYPSTENDVVGQVTKDSLALLMEEEKVTMIDGTWWPIRLNALQNDFSNFGWIRSDVFTYKVKEETPTDPPEDDYSQLKFTIRYLRTNMNQVNGIIVLSSLIDMLKQLGVEITEE